MDHGVLIRVLIHVSKEALGALLSGILQEARVILPSSGVPFSFLLRLCLGGCVILHVEI